MSPTRVLIVAEHASARFGGEAILPLHYFRVLIARGVPVWMLVHDRTRQELSELFPQHLHRIHFVPDTQTQVRLDQVAQKLPSGVAVPTFGTAIQLLTQRRARRMAQEIIARERIDIVHQPIPVSPKAPTLMSDLGAPLVIGPLNGGMVYPPAFAHMEGRSSRLVLGASRAAAGFANAIIPGKRHAACLLVANERTRRALPPGLSAPVIELVENGVDLSLFPSPPERSERKGPIRFITAGRLIELKCIDVAIEAMAHVLKAHDAVFEIVGDGPERERLAQLAQRLGIADRIELPGWVEQRALSEKLSAADVFLFPSVHDCGGAAILEAMARRLPVIATAWGGPMDYLDESCGVVVAPESRASMVSSFAEAMARLAGDAELRTRMGHAGRDKVLAHFDWEKKVDRMLAIYDQARRGTTGRGKRDQPRAPTAAEQLL